jgi:hypothetical protein
VNISFLDSTAQAHMSALSTNSSRWTDIIYCIIGPTFLLLDEIWQIRQHGENWGGRGLHCRWELEGNPLDFSFYRMLVMLQCWYNWNYLVCVTVSHRVVVSGQRYCIFVLLLVYLGFSSLEIQVHPVSITNVSTETLDLPYWMFLWEY